MLATQVTFGAGMLDRAAHLRSDPACLEALWHRSDAGCVALWRGKPLTVPAGDDPGALTLNLLPVSHPVAADARGTAMFLGLTGGAPRFAVDLSDLVATDGDAAGLGGFSDPSVQTHPDLPAGSGFIELRGAMTRLSADDAELAATARALVMWHDIHGFCARCGAKSDVAAAGWQRDCPACGASHYPRTDPVVIVLALSGNRVLMGRSPGWPEGMYSLLAGFVEPGETIEAAAKREVAEESGVRLGAVRVITSQPWPFPASLMIACAAEAETDAIVIDPTEIEDAIWVSREDMVDVTAGRHPTLKPARRGAIARLMIDLWLAGRLS
ncbi:MAG: NAD(+) diphosphatase [Rhodobacteraceae bacterium]|nr:NAD(+) diphosphatase [Paracoccaceae bacterium]